MDLNYYRNNINCVNGIDNFKEISNRIIYFNESNNENMIEILDNLKYFNINAIQIKNKIPNNINPDYVLIDNDKSIEEYCILNKYKYYNLPNSKNLTIIGNIIHSIIKNNYYNIKNIEKTNKINNKNILICGLGLLSNIIINNYNNEHIYVYDDSIIEYYDICNQNLFNIKDIGKKKIDFYKKIKIFNDIENNDKLDKMDIVINSLENMKLRKKINNKCVQLNIPCYDIGIEKSMGHIIPIIPYKTNKINEQEYYKQHEIPECKIENPETIEHCIEHIKRKNIEDIDIFLQKMEKITNKLNIKNIDKYELENNFINRIPRLNSIAYVIIDNLLDYIYYDMYEKLFINLDNDIEIKFTDDSIYKYKSEYYNQLYLSKIIVREEFTEWNYLYLYEKNLNELIDKLEKKYEGTIFTIMMNDKLLYYNLHNNKISIRDLCNKKNIEIYKRNVLNVILNSNDDTILIPKIYLELFKS